MRHFLKLNFEFGFTVALLIRKLQNLMLWLDLQSCMKGMILLMKNSLLGHAKTEEFWENNRVY